MLQFVPFFGSPGGRSVQLGHGDNGIILYLIRENGQEVKFCVNIFQADIDIYANCKYHLSL